MTRAEAQQAWWGGLIVAHPAAGLFVPDNCKTFSNQAADTLFGNDSKYEEGWYVAHVRSGRTVVPPPVFREEHAS